jgi:hypothetical protein
VRLTPGDVAKLVAERFAADTGWELVGNDWSAAENARRATLVSEKYARPEWNEKR